MELNREEKLDFHRIGKYWDRGETEIDIIYADDRAKRLVFGECKLSKKRLNIDALEKKAMKFLDTHRQYSAWTKTLHLYTPGEPGFLFKALEMK